MTDGHPDTKIGPGTPGSDKKLSVTLTTNARDASASKNDRPGDDDTLRHVWLLTYSQPLSVNRSNTETIIWDTSTTTVISFNIFVNLVLYPLLSEEENFFEIAEAVFVGWFTFEYVVRFIAAPRKSQWVHSHLARLILISY